MYDFNPRHQANHVERRYLGTPGTCSIILGTEPGDPKFNGPCGPEYTHYADCLIKQEFNRNVCRPLENELSLCEKTRLDQSQQLAILRDWRKNKGLPVRSSYTPFKIFEEEPQQLEKRN